MNFRPDNNRYAAMRLTFRNPIQTLPVLVALILLALLPMSGARAELQLTSNGIHFGPGDTLTLSVGISQDVSLLTPVDIYFAVIPPASDTAIFISGEPGAAILTPGSIADPQTWTPLAVSAPVTAGFETGLIPFISAPMDNSLATGDYMVAFAMTATGTFEVIDSRFTTIRILENSIKANLGRFSGQWYNNTFGSNGDASIEIVEVAPGVLEGTIDLDGNVGGMSDPDPLVRQAELADFTGLIDYESEDELINGTFGLTLTPQGDISYSVEDIGIGNFFSFNATGTREGTSISLDYQVNSSIMKIADGTFTGEADN